MSKASVELGQWLVSQGLSVCLRLKCNEYICRYQEFTHQLKYLGLKPGMSMFFSGVNVTKQAGFNQFNVALASFSGGDLQKAIAASGKWKRNYRQTQTTEGWFLLTNLLTVQAAVTAYQKRCGIERSRRRSASGVCSVTVKVVVIILKAAMLVSFVYLQLFY